jgi:hypothetical protein
MKKIILIALLIVTGFSAARAQDKNADLAIIVGKSSGLDSVTSAELTKIFKAEKAKGPDGVKFALSARETGSPERAALLGQVYQMTEAEFTKFFLQATFTGAVQSAPKQVAAAAGAKQFVSGTPGGISYVRGSDADDSVKMVKVDGKLPGEDGYPLKIK